MAQVTMYPAMSGSPLTYLTAGITSSQTSFDVVDASKLPDPPNMLTLGGWEDAEVVLYTGKTGNTISGCTRGFGGSTAQAWLENDPVARFFTAKDHNDLISNIEDLALELSTIVLDAGTITFDNTTNGFTAVNVQAAIEEVNSGLGTLETTVGNLSFTATEISFNPASTNLSSTDVQAAIAELDADVAGIVLSAINVTYDPAGTGLIATTVQAAITELDSDVSAINTFVAHDNTMHTTNYATETAVTTHTGTANIHVPIHLSTVEPVTQDGSNGDIWYVYLDV